MTAGTDDVTAVRVVVDRDACVGHGRCYSLAPQVYTSDDEGFVEFVDGDTATTPELVRQARVGVENCPEKALRLDTP